MVISRGHVDPRHKTMASLSSCSCLAVMSLPIVTPVMNSIPSATIRSTRLLIICTNNRTDNQLSKEKNGRENLFIVTKTSWGHNLYYLLLLKYQGYNAMYNDKYDFYQYILKQEWLPKQHSYVVIYMDADCFPHKLSQTYDLFGTMVLLFNNICKIQVRILHNWKIYCQMIT